MWVVVYGRGERFFGVSLCIAARSGADDMQAIRESGFHGADPPGSS